MTAADLYATLGVPRDASPADVHRAYRRASKRAHPDVPGGSVIRFALVSLARDTLMDEARRQHYDETGEVGETPADNKLSDALQAIAAAFEATLAACDSNREDPETVDLPKRMRSWIDFHLRESYKAITAAEALIVKNEAIGKRFEGDTMQLIIRGRVTMLRTKIANIQKNERTAKDALELLDGLQYRSDPARPKAPLSLAQMIRF